MGCLYPDAPHWALSYPLVVLSARRQNSSASPAWHYWAPPGLSTATGYLWQLAWKLAPSPDLKPVPTLCPSSSTCMGGQGGQKRRARVAWTWDSAHPLWCFQRGKGPVPTLILPRTNGTIPSFLYLPQLLFAKTAPGRGHAPHCAIGQPSRLPYPSL